MDIIGLKWHKSPTSGSGNCVEVAVTPERVFVRDTKDRDGPMLSFTPEEWSAFLNRAADSVNAAALDSLMKSLSADDEVLIVSAETYQEKEEFYVCPHHEMTQGWEPCCGCGPENDGDEWDGRLCTEEIEHQANMQKRT